MKKTLTLITIIFLYGCKVYREKRSQAFFNQWRAETVQLLSQVETKTDLDKNIKQIVEAEFCSSQRYKIDRKIFPKLEYTISYPTIEVGVYKNLSDYYWKPRIIKKNPFSYCKTTGLKTLLITPKYKKYLTKKRLKYGFGSDNQKINAKNAKVILESHHTDGVYSEPEKILSHIVFNKNIDTCLVFIEKVYSGTEKRYIKKDGKWKFDKIISELIE